MTSRLAAALVAALLASPALAAEPAPVSLDDALSSAATRNPRLRAQFGDQ